jgi:gelsolin
MSAAQAKLEDSNIAKLGSKEEIDARKAAADTAEEWKGCGRKVGLEIWRIEKLKVIPWPKDQYGSFFDGDSYIVLHTYKDPNKDKLNYNIHFWLGAHTTLDEAGVAAYKTVELDDFLGMVPVEYREVQGFESDEFLSLWPHGVKILTGGIETGFNIVHPEQYKPRLLHVKGTRKNIRVTEVPLDCESLNHGDAFILDAGLNLYQWNGKDASVSEKRRGNEVAHGIQDERNGRPKLHVVDGEDIELLPEFWQLIGGKTTIKSAAEGGSDQSITAHLKKLMRVDIKGSSSYEFVEVAQNSFTKIHLKSDHIFILDSANCVYIWVGSKVEHAQQNEAYQICNQYLLKVHRQLTTPVIRVVDPTTNANFEHEFQQMVQKPSVLKRGNTARKE